MRTRQSLLILFGMALVLITVGTASTEEMPVMVWDETFGDVGWDTAQSVQQTSDGGYIIAGGFSNGGDYDMWLIKTDSTGGEDWNVTFDKASDYAYSVQQTLDDGYILAGEAGSDMWFIKTDSTGAEDWNATFSYGFSSISAYCVQQTNDSGYIATGDGHLIKIDSDGNEEWNQTFFGMTQSVQQTEDDGYILGGSRGSAFLLIKTDLNGIEEWNQTFGSYDDVYAHSVKQTADGGYILVGEKSDDWETEPQEAWVIKTDSNGVEEWSHVYPGTSRAYSVQQTEEGGYIVAGETRYYGAGNSDAWLIKTYANGTEEWNQTFGGSNSDCAYSVQQTEEGDYILAGSTDSYGAGSQDAWLIKVEYPSSNGDDLWYEIDDLWDAIDELWEALSDEIDARIAGDAQLQANITAEEAARIAADVSLQNNITAEEAARIAADAQLQANITAEEAARIAADAQLQANITAEEAARIAADAQLQTNITAEANARIAADNDLRNQIPQFGEWNVSSFDPNIEYTARTDGFVVCYAFTTDEDYFDQKKNNIECWYVKGYTNCTSLQLDLVVADCLTPAEEPEFASITLPVRENDRWKVETNAPEVVIRWIPLSGQE